MHKNSSWSIFGMKGLFDRFLKHVILLDQLWVGESEQKQQQIKRKDLIFKKIETYVLNCRLPETRSIS